MISSFPDGACKNEANPEKDFLESIFSFKWNEKEAHAVIHLHTFWILFHHPFQFPPAIHRRVSCFLQFRNKRSNLLNIQFPCVWRKLDQTHAILTFVHFSLTAHRTTMVLLFGVYFNFFLFLSLFLCRSARLYSIQYALQTINLSVEIVNEKEHVKFIIHFPIASNSFSLQSWICSILPFALNVLILVYFLDLAHSFYFAQNIHCDFTQSSVCSGLVHKRIIIVTNKIESSFGNGSSHANSTNTKLFSTNI